jgi:hypothetical protein
MARKSATDLQELFVAHVRESARAYEWAQKTITYRNAGKRQAAARAKQQTLRCLRRLQRIEERAAGRT